MIIALQFMVSVRLFYRAPP